MDRILRAAFPALVAIATGCSAVLGIEDATVARPSDVAVPSNDAGPAALDGSAATDANACVDTRSDPHHCGACGHDCHGGACRDGACQPVLVASGITHPNAIQVVEGGVYWLATSSTASFPVSTVMGCKESNCEHGPFTLGAFAGVRRDFAVTPTDAYWLDDYKLSRCATTSCLGGAQPLTPITPQRYGPGELAVGGGHAFVVGVQGAASGLFSCDLPSCKSWSLFAPATGAVAADDATVVWLEQDGVHACPVSGCTGGPSLLAGLSEDTGYVGLGVRGNHVYWMTAVQRRIMACSLPRCPSGPTAVARIPSWSTTFAADERDVYFVDPGTGTLRRASVEAPSEPTLVLSGVSVTSIAVGERDVYLASDVTGRISRVAKP